MADDWTPKLETYLDGELSATEMRSADTHIRACPDCAADVSAHLNFRREVKAAGQRYQPSPEFRLRMQRQIAAPKAKAPWLAWAASAAFALLLVAAVVGGYARRSQAAREHAFSEIADLHVANLAGSSPVDVISTDRHTVKPWFQGKIPFTFNLPELQNSEFTLVGGRMTYMDQAPGAHLIYQIRKHQISVFIFQERSVSDKLPTSTGPENRLSFSMETWTEGGLRYFVIGDAASEDIAKLSDLLRTAGHA